ncbi:hypothetical protein FCM35_KLT00652 [Carex littledalei]|uniref:protein-serine/threonine phosphatase n=1 Tax=Carex littledalei TaxID=544730 RepID=A0A833W3G9_9POAL|nr:hypothetical protein FCM35_KLT00652 [Carex littledalei]
MDMGVAWLPSSRKRTYMQMYLRQDYHMDLKAAKKAILEGFQRTDESILKESERGNWQDGATAVCVWVLGQTVVVANIGDAKAVLARASTTNEGETTLKSIILTREHKAIFPQERTRIQKVFGPSDAVEFVQKQLKGFELFAFSDKPDFANLEFKLVNLCRI